MTLFPYPAIEKKKAIVITIMVQLAALIQILLYLTTAKFLLWRLENINDSLTTAIFKLLLPTES
jgi:hypothetical protein